MLWYKGMPCKISKIVKKPEIQVYLCVTIEKLFEYDKSADMKKRKKKKEEIIEK